MQPVSPEGAQFRAHHFTELVHLEDTDPTAIADEAITQAQSARGDYTSETVDLISLSEHPQQTRSVAESAVYDATYAIDRIGDTNQQTETYREGITEALSQWPNLPDDASVTFDMQPDALCDSCIFGEHCKRTNVSYDAETIRTLGWVSEGLEVDDQVEIDGSPEDNSLRLVTTAGIVRQMIKLFKAADPKNPGLAFNATRDTFYQPFMQAVIGGSRDYIMYELPKDHIDPNSFMSSSRY